MILLIFIFLIIMVVFSKIQFKINLNNNDNKVTLIFLYVIKIRINAKANKGVKTYKIKIHSVEFRIRIKMLIQILRDSSEKLKYIFSKMFLNLNIDCTYYILGPDKTAILYGIGNAIIYNIVNIFNIFLKEYIGNINIKPDFENKNNYISINVSISIRFINILIFIFKMLPIIFRYKKFIKSKGGEVNGSSDRGINENYNG